MPEVEIRHPDGRIEHPEVRYEKSDASFRWILRLLVGSMIFAAIVFAAILRFFHGYNDYQSSLRKSPFPLAPAPSRTLETLPPEPRLEQLDRLKGIDTPNVYKRQESKEEILSGYGTTQEKDFIRVPIDQAMRHLAGKLPARAEKAGAEPRDNGLVDSGDPNSGRLFRKEPKWSAR